MKNKRTLAPTRIAMTDTDRGIDPLSQIQTLSPGDALIFRHYELALPERCALGKTLRQACRQHRLLFLVAGDPRLALTLRADGLHLPGWLLKRGFDWHARARPSWHVTAAAHSTSELLGAARSGVDACLLSPVFTTASHPGARTLTLGPVRFAALVSHAPLPVYALGGITRQTTQRLIHTKVAGVAGVAGIGNI